MDHRIPKAGMTELESAKAVARRLFETYDRDRNGVIDQVEALPMMVDAYKSFNRVFTPSRGDIESYSKVMDRNGDGRVTYSDIEELCIKYLCPQFSQQPQQKPTDARLDIARRLFKKYDQQNQGHLGHQDMFRLVAESYRSMGLLPPNNRDVQTWLDAADTNRDGLVSQQEFEQFVLNSLQQ